VGLTGTAARWRAVAVPLHRLTRYLLNDAVLLPQGLELQRSLLGALPAILGLAVLVWGIARGPRRKVLLWLMAAGLTFGMTSLSRYAWGVHHVAFTLFFLTCGFAVALDAMRECQPRLAWGLGLVMLVSWMTFAMRFPPQVIDPALGFEKDQLLASLRAGGLDRSTVQVHTAWGTYYISRLFGDRNQAVLYIEGFGRAGERVAEARRVAHSLGRGLLVVASEESLGASVSAEAVLGPPLFVQRFGPWSMRLYAP
jgi:hypothetical protein